MHDLVLECVEAMNLMLRHDPTIELPSWLVETSYQDLTKGEHV